MLLEGLFVCGHNEAIPLKSLSVRAFLQGYVVGFRSTLIYENNTSNPLEVFFRTPVDDSYAVVGLEASINGRKIRAKVQEKQKAWEMYKDAISSGHTAAFGEEKQGDIFSLVLGNLPPGEKASIQLIMVGELAVEPDGAVRFVLPTVLKPRYTPAGSTDPLAPATPSGGRATRQATGPSDFKFEMVINGASGIAEVQSPSHKIRIQNSGEKMNVSLAEDKQADIIILVRPTAAHKPLVIVEPGVSNGENDFEKDAVIMVSFFPEFEGDSSCLQAACEFVFVVDRSGSMSGSYIHQAAETLQLFLKSIPEGCYFNIIGFGSSYEKLFPESVPYNQENLEKAMKHALTLQADLGGTELFDPLKYVFSHAPMKGLPRQVFVLTDGSISNTDSVIKLVAKHSSTSRCFSFGIGSGASSTLVKGIAEAGKGAAEFITTGERMQPKVMSSLKKAMQPAVTATQVSYVVPNGVTISAIPKTSLPAVFIGERLIVYGILHQDSQSASLHEGSITLTGDLLGLEIEHKMKFHIPAAVVKNNESQVPTIHHLAAKKLIKETEDDSSPEMIKLSCDSSVISSQTAFIAIDEERKDAVKGSLQSWDVQSPYDVEFGGGDSADLRCLGMPSGIYFGRSGASSVSSRCRSANAEKRRGYRAKKAMSSGFSFLSGSSSPRKKNSKEVSSADPPPLPPRRCNAKLQAEPHQKSSDPLPKVINLQLASGAWELSRDLADVITKNVAEIKDACPISCDGDMEKIWATIIALTYLRLRQSQFKDEWELLALKAEAWLAKQNLPRESSIQALNEKAAQFLA